MKSKFAQTATGYVFDNKNFFLGKFYFNSINTSFIRNPQFCSTSSVQRNGEFYSRFSNITCSDSFIYSTCGRRL